MSQPIPPPWTQTAALVRAWDDLRASRASARRNPPPRGIDGMGPTAFESRKFQHCAEVSRILQRQDNGSPTAYRFAPLVQHERETEPGKIRRVYIPRIRDQVVLRSVYYNLAQAMRSGGLRGSLQNPQAVVRTVIQARQRGRKYAARLDVRGFYDSVHHAILANCIAEIDLDAVSKSLLNQLIAETPHRPYRGTRNDNEWRSIGLPTGVSVSTLLAELYLKPLDTEAAKLANVDAYRFVDDVVLLGDDQESLRTAAKHLAQVAATIQLELHGNKTHFSSFSAGFDFLGFKFKGEQLHVAPDRIRKWKQRFESIQRGVLRTHTDASPAEQLQAVVDAFHREISSSGSRHIGYYAMSDDLSVYQEVDRHLRRMLGGLARKAGVPLQLESCHGWAWRYKKDHLLAAARAQAMFPT